MSKLKIIVIIIILLLLWGCTKPSATLAFEFDSEGNYSGFRDLPAHYAVKQTEKDGYYVRLNSKEATGEEVWTAFMEDASNGKNVSLRIVNIFENKPFFQDLFYMDGYYRIFDSTSEDLKDHKFKYLLVLEGRLSNAVKSGKVTILTDNKDLTYHDIMWHYLSSTLKPISPFRLVMLE